jgi:iron complex outermembrane recepter protein
MLWAAAPAYAQSSARLTVLIQDVTGAPLAGVTITIRGPADRVVQTGPDGRFEFENLPGGAYDVDAMLSGFAPSRRTLSLVSGASAELSVTLSLHTVEQTLVTAAKVGDDDVQTVPMAISILPGNDLARAEAHSIEHIAGLAPSVTFSQNTGFSQLTIRGIGTNVVFAGSDPSSAVYVDGVYLARPAMVLADFLGLERIEVLRGPQGALYGRNAVGGALNLITKRPSDDFNASARLVVGDGSMVRSEAWLSGPLVRGRLTGSGALLRGVRRGYVQDLRHPDNPLGGEDVTAGRGQLRTVFNARSDLLVSMDVSHQDPAPLTYAKVLAVKPGFTVDNPTDSHEVRFSTSPYSRNLQYGTAARFTMYLTPATVLTSLSAFRKLDYDLLNDGDITELDLTASHVHEIHHQLSEEVTVSHTQPGLNWIAGLFLFDESDRQPTVVDLGGPRLQNRLDPKVDASSAAAFGQATIGITAGMAVTAGVRLTDERKTIVNAGELSTLDSPLVRVAGSAYAYTDAISATAWTPKLGWEMRAGQNTLAYLSATRGFKSGGFNLTSTQAGRGYSPEWAWSYEAGLKSAIAGGRIRVNVSGFHTTHTNLQVQTALSPGVIDISNAAAATIRGVEIEAATRLASRLQAGGHLAWLDGTYDRYLAVGVGGITSDVAGHRLSNAPEWSGRLWLAWNNQIGSTGTLSFRADSRYQSTVFFTPFNDLIQRQRPYALFDVNAEFSPRHRRWSVGAFIQNFTNEDYITGSFSSPPPAIGGRPGSPRQAGIQLTLSRGNQ